MDKNLAALRGDIADQAQFERTAESIASDPPTLEESLPPRPRARQSFVDLADAIYTEAEAEGKMRDELGKRLWNS